MSGRLSILYVDDDADMRAIVGMALARVAGGDWVPGLILLDVMMPAMDGPAVMTRLRAVPQLAVTPVAFLTARAGEGDVARYLALGAAAVIAKPFDPVTFAERLRTVGQVADLST